MRLYFCCCWFWCVCLCCYLKSNDPIHTNVVCKVTTTNTIPWDYSAYIDLILRLHFMCISGWWSFWIELGDFKFMHIKNIQCPVQRIHHRMHYNRTGPHTRMFEERDFKWYLERVARVAILGIHVKCATLAQIQPSCMVYSLLFSIQSTKYFWALLRGNFRQQFSQVNATNKMRNFESFFFECLS